jgi:hypothetical protein
MRDRPCANAQTHTPEVNAKHGNQSIGDEPTTTTISLSNPVTILQEPELYVDHLSPMLA